MVVVVAAVAAAAVALAQFPFFPYSLVSYRAGKFSFGGVCLLCAYVYVSVCARARVEGLSAGACARLGRGQGSRSVFFSPPLFP